MGHLRRQCTKPQTPFTANRGKGHGTPFDTRRGRFRQNFGPSRASPLSLLQDMAEGFMINTPMIHLERTHISMEPNREYTKITLGRWETTTGMALRRLIPQQLMTCLTALNCFKTTRPEFSRPNVDISLGGVKVRALFDTGSGVTLCNHDIRPLAGLPCSTIGLPELRTPYGSSLRVDQPVGWSA